MNDADWLRKRIKNLGCLWAPLAVTAALALLVAA